MDDVRAALVLEVPFPVGDARPVVPCLDPVARVVLVAGSMPLRLRQPLLVPAKNRSVCHLLLSAQNDGIQQPKVEVVAGVGLGQRGSPLP